MNRVLVVAQRKCDFNWLSLIKPSPFLHWYTPPFKALQERKNVFWCANSFVFLSLWPTQELNNFATKNVTYVRAMATEEPTASSCFWAKESCACEPWLFNYQQCNRSKMSHQLVTRLCHSHITCKRKWCSISR